MAVDNHPEITFSIPRGTLPWQPNFVGFSAWVSLDRNQSNKSIYCYIYCYMAARTLDYTDKKLFTL